MAGEPARSTAAADDPFAPTPMPMQRSRPGPSDQDPAVYPSGQAPGWRRAMSWATGWGLSRFSRSENGTVRLGVPLQEARVVLARLLRGSASLKLAVGLIAVLVAVMAWATVLESRYGTPAVHFGVYRAWWFLLLVFLLGLNVAAAVLVRFPWNRRQCGFLLTHLGILVLLAGALLSYLKGVSSQLAVVEGGASRRAYRDAQHFALEIRPAQPGTADRRAETKTVEVPFSPGPFNWQDYRKLSWFPWGLARPSRGTVYDHDGITLEVLDYFGDSRRVALPRITLRTDSRSASAGGQQSGGPVRMTLSVVASNDPHAAGRRFGVGEHQATPQGDCIVFWMTGSRAETDAFLDGLPEEPLGYLGQVVLCHGGKTYRFRVDEWQQEPRQPLGDTGLEIELLAVNTVMLGVMIEVHRPDDPPQPMTLLATLPQMNRHDRLHGVFGSYWVDPQFVEQAGTDRSQLGQELLAQAGQRRIDVVQGPDLGLYWRTWQPPALAVASHWPGTGPEAAAAAGDAKVVAFEQSDRPVTLTLEEFLPQSEPGWQIVPMPFEKEDLMRLALQPRARVRLSVDGSSEEFWLAAATGQSLPDERQEIASADRRVAIGLPRDFIDLGFTVFLQKFSRKLDPGTSAVSHYSSLVDLADAGDPDRRLQEDVLISLNAPVSIRDPQTGRSYRLYQSGYRGPFRPGDPQLAELAGGAPIRDRLFQSQLAVNYDPGRGPKYVGCLMICLGITITFYRNRNRGAAMNCHPNHCHPDLPQDRNRTV